MLAQHLHYAAVGGKLAAVEIFGEELLEPEFLAYLIDGIKFVRGVLVRAEHAEILHVRLHDVPQKSPQRAGIFGLKVAGLLQLDAVFSEVGQPQGFLEASAVGVEISAHAPMTRWCQFAELS